MRTILLAFVYDDGGRKAAGFKGVTGDCVCRSIAVAADLPYTQVYDALAAGTAGERRTKHHHGISGKLSAAHGVHTQRKWFKDYMTSLGFVWTTKMLVGQGCKCHLRPSELPNGRLVVAVSRHMVAVIDGVIHDIYRSDRLGNRCVYGYWRLTRT